MTTCSVLGCSKKSKTLGFCGTHYARFRVHGSTDKRRQYEDLTGRVFDKLTILEIAEDGEKIKWKCRCSCGGSSVVASSNLKSGHIKSCGCRRSESASSHGMSKTSTYRSWIAMRRRCSDEKYIEWHLYGGRGIRVCARWENSFDNFLEDMGIKPASNMSIDRIDGNGNYEPQNCKWSTPKEQSVNRRNHPYKGRALADICAEAGLNLFTVQTRMRRQGMTLDEALSAPLHHRQKRA